MWVSTPMSQEKESKTTLSPDAHAKAAVEKLGHDDWTNGHWIHALQYHLIYMIPDDWFQQKILNSYRKKY